MNNKDLVSIIVPVYNREAFLEECINSVFDQTHQNLEIILIDDGSTDDSLKVCQRLAEKDSRIKLLTQQHGGVSNARNIGLDAAEGEFVFFLDSDDIIHPRLLETLIKGFKLHGVSLGGTTCHGCRNKFWGKGKEIFLNNSTPLDFTYHTHEETFERIFHGGSPLNMIGGVMMRRELIGDTRFHPDIFIGEDFYFIYQNLIKGAAAVFLNESGYLNRLHENNTSWQYDFDGFWTRFYRRKLVWESEESFGRTEYANIQKRAAYGCFLVCFPKNAAYSSDSRKMCKVLREHKNEILPALNLKLKIFYLLCLYFPASSKLISFCKRKIKTKKQIERNKKRKQI